MAAHIPQESPKKISEFSHHPRPVAINFKFQPKIQGKSAISDTFFTFFFVLAIFMVILCQAIMAIFNKIAIMAILVWVDMAINMVNIGVYAKRWQNVDNL